MTWRDRLRPGKLGSASFEIMGADAEVGRNGQVFEYPGRDKPYVEDLGRAAREFQLECIVLSRAANGYNYMPARDALMAEIEKPGPKTLVHPYYGEMKVSVVGKARIHESPNEGGSARITITLIESGELLFPTAAADTPVVVKKYFTDIIGEVESNTAFSVLNQPEFVSSAAVNMVRGLADRISELTNQVVTLPDPMADFVSVLGELSDAASQFILIPQALVSQITGLFDQLTSIVAEPAAAIDIVRSLFDYGDDLPDVPLTTPARLQQAENQQALTTIVQVAAIATAAKVASEVDYDSADDALTMRDELIEAIDNTAEQIDSDDLYSTLLALRAASVSDLETRAAQLARLIRVTLPESTPAIVLAYQLYGDALRDSEIIARNAIADPNMLPSGVALEVLSG